ncbi:MAG TPA: hypothetical protein VER32_15905 [Pyrinomonadaceae bacterium]|nr:hypothetical protein [Pyrinomonadaceae bacterium]
MTATLIIAFFLLAAASFVIIRSKRSKPTGEADFDYLPTRARGLFGDDSPRALNAAAREAADDERARRVRGLRERAGRGEIEVLRDEALRADARLYAEILDTLVANVDASPDKLAAVASTVSRGDGLRATKRLADSLLRAHAENPEAIRAADLLRVAALSDDAETFAGALDAIFEAWRAGSVPRLTASDLSDLFEAEYHLLAPAARQGGSAFLLLDKLRHYRGRLSEHTAGTRRASPAAKSDDG